VPVGSARAVARSRSRSWSSGRRRTEIFAARGVASGCTAWVFKEAEPTKAVSISRFKNADSETPLRAAIDTRLSFVSASTRAVITAVVAIDVVLGQWGDCQTIDAGRLSCKTTQLAHKCNIACPCRVGLPKSANWGPQP
jgi:hypothetical protein